MCSKIKNKEEQRLILALFINWSIEIYTLDVYKTTESLVIKGFSAIQNLLRHNLGFQNCIKDGKNIDPEFVSGDIELVTQNVSYTIDGNGVKWDKGSVNIKGDGNGSITVENISLIIQMLQITM